MKFLEWCESPRVVGVSPWNCDFTLLHTLCGEKNLGRPGHVRFSPKILHEQVALLNASRGPDGADGLAPC